VDGPGCPARLRGPGESARARAAGPGKAHMMIGMMAVRRHRAIRGEGDVTVCRRETGVEPVSAARPRGRVTREQQRMMTGGVASVY